MYHDNDNNFRNLLFMSDYMHLKRSMQMNELIPECVANQSQNEKKRDERRANEDRKDRDRDCDRDSDAFGFVVHIPQSILEMHQSQHSMKDVMDHSVCLKRFVTLYEEYMGDASHCSINVSYGVRNKARNQIQMIVIDVHKATTQVAGSCENKNRKRRRALLNVFDKAAREVYRLMARDSFYRFSRTSAFKHFDAAEH